MINRLKSLSTFLKRKVNNSTLASRPCVGCLQGAGQAGLCSGCIDDLPRNDRACARCALPLAEFASRQPRPLCGPCLAHPPAFRRVVAPWLYAFPVNSLIGRFKYSGNRAFGKPLTHLLADEIIQRDSPIPDCLIPVPMHQKRERRRGFNQAEEMAFWLGDRLAVPVNSHCLRRRRENPAQSGLNRRQRLKNLRGAFEVRGPIPARVALIDDVMTTGATVEELSRLLRKRGAESIEVWALARTPKAPVVLP